MCIKEKAAPGRGSGNTKGHYKNKEKIVVTRSFIGDYAATLEIFYFDAGKQYKTTAFTKNLDALDNETQFKDLIGGIIAACKERRASK
ncbi:hypothetical protein [Prolixibacter sp. SD074]|jgi:hypothetical protein|uniref:hypothetical protein n=1 Tax=Prolixibacter sp. SD074 TaxID=2652391 RepID=UPI00126AB5AB|nr:hypothetical protein [Prolixibacter sp. SD074]GET28783.1 hypothetical protein SD074_09850 [Prolixibacter sp. SD074]